jgi:energy coupling factor transporter S component ThiW
MTARDTQLDLKKLTLSAVLIALGTAGSFLPFMTFPIGPCRCAPLQHSINVIGAILLGPGYALANAFLISLLRNLFGVGSLLAFPGSMIGALLAGWLYRIFATDSAALIGEWVGTGLIGSLLAYPVARYLIDLSPASTTFFVLPFALSTLAGGLLATLILPVLRKAISLPVRSDRKKAPEDGSQT